VQCGAVQRWLFYNFISFRVPLLPLTPKFALVKEIYDPIFTVDVIKIKTRTVVCEFSSLILPTEAPETWYLSVQVPCCEQVETRIPENRTEQRKRRKRVRSDTTCTVDWDWTFARTPPPDEPWPDLIYIFCTYLPT